jgi:hypothetical protein
MKNTTVGLLFAVAFLFGTAQAMTIKDYTNAKKVGGTAWQVMEIYIKGVSNGFTMANAFIANNNEKLMYCQPDKFALDVQNLVNIVDETLRKPKPVFTDDNPIEIVVMAGLQDTFPCGSHK